MKYLLWSLDKASSSLSRGYRDTGTMIARTLRACAVLFCPKLKQAVPAVIHLRIGLLSKGSSNRVKNFLFSTSSRRALGSTQPPIHWVPVTLSPGVKRPGRETDHSPPTSAEVKKMWIYTFAPPYAFIA
jgi:hypothetical protein